MGHVYHCDHHLGEVRDVWFVFLFLVCILCYVLIVLPLGVIGRLCSETEAISLYLLYYLLVCQM